jgi:hypothetical protein
MWFKNVKSFEDLKSQFRALAKANHPDNGGSAEAMTAIVVEYESLFPIWKGRKEAESGKAVNESAASTRREFYTQCGWEGSNYNGNLSLKEIAQIVRGYVKEKYPTFRFSVRTHYASMCEELMVSLTQAPFEPYKTVEELSEDDIRELWLFASKYSVNWSFTNLFVLDDVTINEIKAAYAAGGKFSRILREDVKAMFDDVDHFVNSYNYSDSDGMIDYFDVNFYYFNCEVDYCKFKVVEKKARIANPKQEVSTSDETNKEGNGKLELDEKDYSISKTEHTKTHETIYVVKVLRTLEKAEYIEEAKKMKSLGGYYSKFVHGFVFRQDPTELLAS